MPVTERRVIEEVRADVEPVLIVHERNLHGELGAECLVKGTVEGAAEGVGEVSGATSAFCALALSIAIQMTKKKTCPTQKGLFRWRKAAISLSDVRGSYPEPAGN